MRFQFMATLMAIKVVGSLPLEKFIVILALCHILTRIAALRYPISSIKQRPTLLLRRHDRPCADLVLITIAPNADLPVEEVGIVSAYTHARRGRNVGRHIVGRGAGVFARRYIV